MEEQKLIGGKLAALNSYLDAETAVLRDTHEQNKQELVTINQEKQRLDLEERSYTYWLRSDEHALASRRLEQSIQKIKESLKKAQTGVEMFETWIEKEKDYQICRRRLSEVSEETSGAEGRKSELITSLDKLQVEIGRLSSEVEQTIRESREMQKKHTAYQDAPEAELVEGTLEDLEARLKSLKATYSGEIEQLEKRKSELQSECAKKGRNTSKSVF